MLLNDLDYMVSIFYPLLVLNSSKFQSLSTHISMCVCIELNSMKTNILL